VIISLFTKTTRNRKQLADLNFIQAPVLVICIACSWMTPVKGAESDPYEEYVRHSEDFRAVKQDKTWAYKAFPSWTYMPWTYQWNIGYNDESGDWSQKGSVLKKGRSYNCDNCGI